MSISLLNKRRENILTGNSRLIISAPRVGLIGGMGSAASMEAMARLFHHLDPDDRHIMVENLPMENVFEHLCGNVIEIICAAIARMGGLNISAIGIPCNTVHFYEDEIRRKCGEYGIKFLSIIECTVGEVQRRQIGVVSILATATGAELYRKAFERTGIKIITPSLEQQIIINAVVRAVLLGPPPQILRELRSALEGIAETHAKEGAQSIVLGCTELPLVFSTKVLHVEYVSSIEMLAIHLAQEIRTSKSRGLQCVRL